jgi:hypothetical protein
LSPVQESEDYANESKAEDTNFESKEGHLIWSTAAHTLAHVHRDIRRMVRIRNWA